MFLLLVWLQESVADVAPPTNVTLHCHNMKNVVKWSYEDPPPPGLRFRVNLRSFYPLNSFPNEMWVDPPAQQQDVSFLNDPQNDYFLSVTAVIGQNESPPTDIVFSYSRSSPAEQKCNLDFPSVNVTARHNGSVLFRFSHPWLLYFQKPTHSPSKNRRKKKSAELPEFQYDVQIVNQGGTHTFFCEDSVCEEELLVDAAQEKHCLKMQGELQAVSVQAKQAYCAPRQETPSYLLPLCVCGGLLVLSSLGLVILMLYRKGTKADIAPPDFLIFPNKRLKATHTAPKEALNVPEVGSPTRLLPAEEEEARTPLSPRFTEPEFRLPIGVFARDEGVIVDEEAGMDGESGYMGGKDLDQEDEDEAPYSGNVHVPYEKRPVLDNLAPGELTEGYRG